MKLTDTTGRNMMVDLMVKDGSRWALATAHKLNGRKTNFVEVPYGKEYAIQLVSMHGVEAIVFENGQRVLQTAVGPRAQYLSVDSQGRAFTFKAEGDDSQNAAVSDVKVHANQPDQDEKQDDLFTYNTVKVSAPEVPSGNGMVFLVVRFAKQNDPHGEPPQEEFELSFKMLSPDDYSAHVAQNFHKLEQAPAIANVLNPFSYEPPSESELAHRPSRYCSFCKCVH